MGEKDQVWVNPDEDENGINLERLRENLALTPEEKLERHRKACESVIALREAARRYWDSQSSK